MKDRDAEVLEAIFDLEALWRCYILKVYSAECRRNGANYGNNLIGFVRINANGKCVNVCQFLEQQRLAFHDGHRAFGPNVAESKDSGAIAHDCDHISLAGEVVDSAAIAHYLSADGSDARTVGS